MPYDIKYNSALLAVELVFTGTLSGEDLRKCTDEGINLEKEHGVYAMLIDALDLEQPPSVTDVYDLPQQYDEGGFSKSNRLAFVRPRSPAANEVAQFYEDVCVNRGWRVQPFGTRDEAVAWLTSSESS
jgi:hypothetical protein